MYEPSNPDQNIAETEGGGGRGDVVQEVLCQDREGMCGCSG